MIVRVAGPEKQALKVIKEIHGVKLAELQGSKEKGTVDIIVESVPEIDIRKPLFYAMSKASYPCLLYTSRCV